MSFQTRGRQFSPDDVPWDRVLLVTPIVILLSIVFYLLWNAFYTVEPDEKAVVLRFGRYHETVGSGLQFCIPLVDKILKVSIREQSFQLPDMDGTHPGSRNEGATLMLTGDLNAVFVRWTVQWKVEKPEDFLFRFYREGDRQGEYAEEVIRTVSQTVMNQLIGDYSIEEVLTEKREDIAVLAREQTQAILDDYKCGVTIRGLQMQRVTPPEKVRPAFDAVNSSIQRRDQLKNEGNKIRNELLPKARAEKDKLIREAQGYTDRRWAEANGEINALLARYHAYAKAPEVTRQRLYIEAMERVLAGVENKVIIDADLQGGILPLLQLDKGDAQ
ncbi:MAG: FtsH protease activity modulator HflK [Thermoguttaceae bacterium]